MDNNLDNPGRSQEPGPKSSSPDTIWNAMTIVMLLGTLCLDGYFTSLLMNPYSFLNPLPPNTPTFTPIPPTWTPIGLPATWTPTLTVEPTMTNTPRPTYTLEPSATIFTLATATSLLPPSKTAKPTGVPYASTINYYDSTTFRPDTSCNVMLVAGQTLDGGNNPVTGLIVKMGGSLPGKVFNPPSLVLTGTSTAYGPSGFEFNPGLAPVATNKSVWVQLFDQSGSPISTQVFLTTYTDCKKNLIFVRFQQK